MNKPILRCSNLDRFLTCPGSRTLDHKRVEAMQSGGSMLDLTDDGDEMTWRGNWCHHHAARTLVREHGALAPDGLVGPVLPLSWSPSVWDERSARWFVERVLEDTPSDHVIFVERRFAWQFDHFQLTGQLDVYTLNADRTVFTIEDQKAGPNEVEPAEENWQLAGYAVLLKKIYPTLQRGVMRIRQHAAEFRTTEVELDELDTLPDYLEGKIDRALEDWNLLETSYRACRLCDNIEFCPALHKEIDAMKHALTKDEVDRLKTTPALKELAEIAARGRAIHGPITRLLERLKERIAEEGSTVLADGTPVRIVEEDGRRVVTQPEIAFDFARAKLRELTDNEDRGHDLAWKTLSMSLTELEDVLVELGVQRKSVKPDLETAESWIKDQLGHIITRTRVKKLKFS